MIVPFDLVKVRLQDPASVRWLVGSRGTTRMPASPDTLLSFLWDIQRSLYKNTFDCFAKILRTEGKANDVLRGASACS